MSEFLHIRKPGVACAPKAEMVSNNTSLTEDRVYLIPIIMKGQEIPDQYNFDMTVDAGGDILALAALYKQVGRIGSSGATAQLISTSQCSVAVVASSNFRTLNMVAGTEETYLPGSYWIAFRYEVTSGTPVVSSNNSTRTSILKGRWVHRDPGSATFPTSINGTDLVYTATGEYPIWGALRYTGDAFP